MNVSANGLSALAVHDHAPLFATTSAPYTTSSAYGSSTSTANTGGVRKGQRMNVYRMEHREEASPDVNAFDSGRYTPSGANGLVGKDSSRRMSNGYPFPSIGATDSEGMQPLCLSSTLLRGDVGNAIGLGGAQNGSSANLSGPVDSTTRDNAAGRRKWGAHQNALAFHPVSFLSAHALSLLISS